jgi:uncharacterized protein YjiS (DUF1127 family)
MSAKIRLVRGGAQKSRNVHHGGGNMSEGSSAAFAAGNDLGRTIVRALRRGRHYLRALRELDGLDDHDLRDLRIPRPDVSRIAWDEACRRMDAAA